MGLPMSRLVETLARPARSASHHLQLSQAPGDTWKECPEICTLFSCCPSHLVCFEPSFTLGVRLPLSPCVCMHAKWMHVTGVGQNPGFPPSSLTPAHQHPRPSRLRSDYNPLRTWRKCWEVALILGHLSGNGSKALVSGCFHHPVTCGAQEALKEAWFDSLLLIGQNRSASFWGGDSDPMSPAERWVLRPR